MSYGTNISPSSSKPGFKVTVKNEYEKLKSIFEGCDEKQLSLIDGAIYEAARLKVELDALSKIIEITGLIQYNPKNPIQQKELPVAKEIIKVRANYLNYISKLSNILGKSLNDDEDDELNDYE